VLKLKLIGHFGASELDGEPIAVPPTGARLLALLALHRHGLTRGCVGGILWPEKDEERASANLRSALWRLKKTRSIAIVDREPSVIQLAANVQVDLDQIQTGCIGDGVTIEQLLCDLLDGWRDPWVQPFRLRWRQTRLHAVDAQCHQLIEYGAYDEAVALAQLVLAVEPLRESILRLMVQAELCLEQPMSAANAIERYRRQLDSELGARVSPKMHQMASRVAAELQNKSLEPPAGLRFECQPVPAIGPARLLTGTSQRSTR
jgi:DNA-binding SARP family transcriptional activator